MKRTRRWSEDDARDDNTDMLAILRLERQNGAMGYRVRYISVDSSVLEREIGWLMEDDVPEAALGALLEAEPMNQEFSAESGHF